MGTGIKGIDCKVVGDMTRGGRAVGLRMAARSRADGCTQGTGSAGCTVLMTGSKRDKGRPPQPANTEIKGIPECAQNSTGCWEMLSNMHAIHRTSLKETHLRNPVMVSQIF